MSTPNSPPGSNTTADSSDERPDDPNPISVDTPLWQVPSGTGRQWRRSVTRKIEKVVASVMRKMPWGRKLKPQAEEDCIRRIEVTRQTVDGEYLGSFAPALARFDTACDANLVTKNWLQKHDMEHLIKRIKDGKYYHIIKHQNVESYASEEVEMEWYGRNESREHQVVFLKHLSQTDRFLVVPDTNFEIIIGLETIKSRRLTRPELSFFGDTQGGYSYSIQPSSEKTRQAGREEQRKKKEEQRAKRNQQSHSSTSNGTGTGNGTGSSSNSA